LRISPSVRSMSRGFTGAEIDLNAFAKARICRNGRAALIVYDSRDLSECDVVTRLLPSWRSALTSAYRARIARGDRILPREPCVSPGFTVLCDIPGRLRVTHPLIRSSSRVRQVLGAGLRRLDGVRRFRLTLATGGILINYEPNRLTRSDL